MSRTSRYLSELKDIALAFIKFGAAARQIAKARKLIIAVQEEQIKEGKARRSENVRGGGRGGFNGSSNGGIHN